MKRSGLETADAGKRYAIGNYRRIGGPRFWRVRLNEIRRPASTCGISAGRLATPAKTICGAAAANERPGA